MKLIRFKLITYLCKNLNYAHKSYTCDYWRHQSPSKKFCSVGPRSTTSPDRLYTETIFYPSLKWCILHFFCFFTDGAGGGWVSWEAAHPARNIQLVHHHFCILPKESGKLEGNHDLFNLVRGDLLLEGRPYLSSFLRRKRKWKKQSWPETGVLWTVGRRALCFDITGPVWPDGFYSFHYLSIYYHEKLPNCIQNLPKSVTLLPNTK